MTLVGPAFIHSQIEMSAIGYGARRTPAGHTKKVSWIKEPQAVRPGARTRTFDEGKEVR